MTEVTYGQIDKVLRKLGFSVHISKGDDLRMDARVYEHKETGAFLPLPAFPLEQKVYPHHLVAVRGTLDNFGIADPPMFAEELQKAS
jgi:hypothetical protein